MTTTLFGGPLDGLQIELPEAVDKLAVVDDRGRVHRYETDGEWEVLEQTPAGERIKSGADMRLTDNAEEFDRELLGAMRGWDEAT